tara:strand:- start:463 stop:642 length:180 start_codon:yes stop_codon:yes gene_type:complete
MPVKEQLCKCGSKMIELLVVEVFETTEGKKEKAHNVGWGCPYCGNILSKEDAKNESFIN